MIQKDALNNKKHQPSQSDIVDLQKLALMIIGNWYYFLICIVIAGVAAYFYSQHSLPTYRVTTTLLIEEEDNARMPGVDNMLQGVGLRPGPRNLDNQIDILSLWVFVGSIILFSIIGWLYFLKRDIPV